MPANFIFLLDYVYVVTTSIRLQEVHAKSFHLSSRRGVVRFNVSMVARIQVYIREHGNTISGMYQHNALHVYVHSFQKSKKDKSKDAATEGSKDEGEKDSTPSSSSEAIDGGDTEPPEDDSTSVRKRMPRKEQ